MWIYRGNKQMALHDHHRKGGRGVLVWQNHLYRVSKQAIAERGQIYSTSLCLNTKLYC
jgi:hypothetical protein